MVYDQNRKFGDGIDVIKELKKHEKQNGDVVVMRIIRIKRYGDILLEKNKTFRDRETGQTRNRRVGFTYEDIDYIVMHSEEILKEMENARIKPTGNTESEMAGSRKY